MVNASQTLGEAEYWRLMTVKNCLSSVPQHKCSISNHINIHVTSLVHSRTAVF